MSAKTVLALGIASNLYKSHEKILAKAISDPKYAEVQRRETLKTLTSETKTMAEQTKQLNAARATQLTNNKNITVLAGQIINLDSNNDGVVNAGGNQNTLNAKIAALKVAQNNTTNIQKTLTKLTQSLGILNITTSSERRLLSKLDEFTQTTSTVLLNGGGGNGSNPQGSAGNTPALDDYIYNAPMMNSAYFSSNSIQTAFTKSGKSLPEGMKNALTDAFKYNGTRGAIQMNADTRLYLNTQAFKAIKGKVIKPEAYGFRFHYNPTTVSLSYGQMQEVSPELLEGGEGLKFNPITPLGQGGFSFDLYLNRIDDLNYIQPNGQLQILSTPPGPVTSPPTLPDIKTFNSTDLYPSPVSASELKEIYKKGTMYDIEYIFRAVHGGSNDYRSKLRGMTSDIGWIAGIAVEFHLGDNMRYLGRINGVSVNHVLLNERMVPMLTVINIQASRFYDVPPTAPKKLSSRGGGGNNAAVAE